MIISYKEMQINNKSLNLIISIFEIGQGIGFPETVN